MFYVLPPNGQIPLHVMEKCVYTRLEYLEYLYTNQTNDFEGNFQYLLENSAYDKVGHFILRLIASTSIDLWMYWLPRERLLLKHRLDNITRRQLNSLFQSIIRQLDTVDRIESDICLNIREVCLFCLQSTVFEHIMLKNHANDCCVFQFKVKFDLVPELIKKKEIDLIAGYAVVYCSQWKNLLVALFSTYLVSDLKHTKTHAWHVDNDVRLQSLKQQIEIYISPNKLTIGKVNNNNINVEVEKFPLCMQHLHRVLKKKHRLSHYARLYYSLFLKESGMKVDDAIQYWKEEYSKPHTCTSVCTHDWQTNENKFLYNIRHLYGLEGSRKDYKSPNCTVICAQAPGAVYEGGCPFKHFNSDKFIDLLNNSLTKDQIDQFLQNMPSEKPEILCSTYFKIVHKNYDGNVNINSPLQYYAMANK
ncbi:PREDICTED: DNA primase large subunit-like [Polistes canadensis]|uniref:DNA primase large subunit-like n=1 Tax=Polistes canadensis TaxID=91411 RepID=UPI000718AEBB|nr:PREDICTED: DNA primase large subunit-like [Polistes canadensis]